MLRRRVIPPAKYKMFKMYPDFFPHIYIDFSAHFIMRLETTLSGEIKP